MELAGLVTLMVAAGVWGCDESWQLEPLETKVRVTVVGKGDHAVVTTPFDLTNKTPSRISFRRSVKSSTIMVLGSLPYKAGIAIKTCTTNARIISTNGRNNIEAIKKYFVQICCQVHCGRNWYGLALRSSAAV